MSESLRLSYRVRSSEELHPGYIRNLIFLAEAHALLRNSQMNAPFGFGTKVKLRFDPFDISYIYVYVHNHWVECIISSYYGQLHGHSEREIMLASAELREQNQESHVRTPIDAKRLADFLAKIEAYEAVLLQRQRDIENQIVVYHIEGKWVFSELKNEPVCPHFYCITSCLLAHCPFGRFFLAFLPLYSGGSDARLSHRGESSPLSKETSRVYAQRARASSGVCQTLVVCERGGLTCRHRFMGLYQASTILR